MDNLNVITAEDSEHWDDIVRSFKNYDVYYLSGYSKAFKLHGDGEPTLFYYENHNIRAMNVVMKRDIEKDERFSGKLPENSYFDMTTPYGYGGFLIEGKATEDSLRHLDAEYSALCKSKSIISEFVRFHPLLKNSEILEGVYDISMLGKTISMNLDSKENILSGMTSRDRGKVRKVQKLGGEIFWGRDAELYREFIQLYNVTMDKNNAKNYYYFGQDFYDSILKDLKYNALMFYAVYQGKKIAMSIILLANQQMHYHLGASDIDYRHLAPTNFLFYETACWGCENGYKTFHLGGGLGSSEDSLYKFKSAFNRKSDNTFAIGRKIFDEEKYEELINMRKSEVLRTCDAKNSTELSADADTDYFPKYRAEFN